MNGTADPGLSSNWDGQYLSASGSNAAAYNMFEFDVSSVSLNNFTLYWKGNGWTNKDLLPVVKVNTGAVGRLIQLTQEGYAQIQP